MNRIFRNVAIAAALCLSIIGCDKNRFDQNLPEVIARYEISIRDSQDEMTIILSGLDSDMDITLVDNPISWLKTSFSKEQDITLFNLKRLDKTPDKFVKDSIQIKLNTEQLVSVVVNRADVLVPGGDNNADYAKFNTTWWEQESIAYANTIIKDGVPSETYSLINLPWNTITSSNIPSGLIFSSDTGDNLLNAKYGWEMAFNLFDSRDSEGKISSKPYFALYNKFTGILRVFYYQVDAPGTGGEFLFFVTPGLDETQKYPLYNSLQYGIPMSAGEIQKRGNVLGVTDSPNNMFAQYVTPFLKNPSKTALSTGWYCFDLDYSAYNPTVDTSFKPNIDRLSIDCMTASVEKVTLRGALSGNIDGSFESTSSYSTTTSNGVNYLDQFNSGVQGIFDCIANFTAGEYLKGVGNGGLTIYHLAKALFGYATDDYTTTGTTTGTINMTLGADMNMSGYNVAQTSNSSVSVEFDCSSYNQSAHLGQGVWSLAENPIVYVVYDDLLYAPEYGDVAFTVKDNGLYTGNMNPVDADFRLFTFFDPASIKVNINEKVFGTNNTYELYYTYGVFPNRPLGYYDKYKNGLLDFNKNGCVAKPSIIDRSKVKKDQGVTIETMPKYGTYTDEWDMLAEKRVKIAPSLKPDYYKQNGESFRYYGCISNGMAADNEDMFIFDPIVLLPTGFDSDNNNDGMLYDFVAPDFIVGLSLQVVHSLEDGTKAKTILSKSFIPEVRAISAKEFYDTIYPNLQKSITGSVDLEAGSFVIKTKLTSKYDGNDYSCYLPQSTELFNKIVKSNF